MRYDFLIAGLYLAIISFMIFGSVFIFTRKQILYGLKIIGVLAIANVLFMFGEVVKIMSDSENILLIFSHIGVVGFIFIPFLWYLLSSQQKNQTRSFSSLKLILLLHIPLIALLISFFYPWDSIQSSNIFIQKWFFSNYEIVSHTGYAENFISIIFNKGIIYYIIVIYNMVLLLISLYNYYFSYRYTPYSSKMRSFTLIFSSLMMFFFYVTYLINQKTFIIDYIPFGIFILLILAFYSLYKYELFDLTPMAYRRVYEEAAFPVLIFDKSQYMISMNRKAKDLHISLDQPVKQLKLEDLTFLGEDFPRKLREKGYAEYKTEKDDIKTYYHVKLDTLSSKSRFMGYLLTFQDVTLHKLELKRMEYMANYDDLTKTLNRRVFFSRAMPLFDEYVIHKGAISFIMIDLDDFKEINDIYGHQAGNYVLSKIASVCQDAISDDIIFARYGGEEFVLFLGNYTPDEAMKISSKIRTAIADREFVYMKHRIRVTASFGVSGTKGIISKSFEQYLKDADDALYEAKRRGKNQIHCIE